MIHICIGTKAQFIKMAPIMQRLSEQNIPFNLIDLGQHSLITQNLRQEFGLKEPDVYLSRGQNVSTLFKGLVWSSKQFIRGLNRAWVKKAVFLNQGGICLIHGDTVSTLLALYLAKRANLKVAHVEAGLRSFNYFEPFPEEILRVKVMKKADVLFSPSKWAFANLKEMGLGQKSLLVSGNTSFESINYSLKKDVDLNLDVEKFALVTVHRMENIFSRKRLEFILDVIDKVSQSLPVVFVQHPPTLNQLKKFKLQQRLNSLKNIYFFRILSHAHFTHLLQRSECVFTDGGSIQEESYYLDKPCFLFRRFTERKEGLGQNVVLCGFSNKKTEDFLNNYKTLKRQDTLTKDISPSTEIVKHILEISNDS